MFQYKKYFFILLLLNSCSGLQMIEKSSRESLYSKHFTEKIRGIKSLYQAGKEHRALNILKNMDREKELLPSEDALRMNLMGVIFFSQKDFQQASHHFEQALQISHPDVYLEAKVTLNLASSYYKSHLLKKSYETLVRGNGEQLADDDEYQKYYKLRYVLADELKQKVDAVKSLIYYFKNNKSLTDLKSDRLFTALLDAFSSLSDREKLTLLYEFEDEKLLIVGHLGHLESEKLYYKGHKERSIQIMKWLQKYFPENKEISQLVEKLLSRLENDTKIDSKLIGVILPLTGPQAVFGKRALLGIDSAIKNVNKDLPQEKKLKLAVRDSQSSGVVGAYEVRNLVETHFVPVIIGGLFPTLATQEYLEARKLGVFYLSLSQVTISREQKDHLLLEIPGSIESQVKKLFSKKALGMFGKKVAIIYPQGDFGRSYLQEFWRKAKLENLDVTAAISFKEEEGDYRIPIKKLLGLRYERERKEELDLLSEIHSLEKSRSIRKIQILRPQIDFDWIFLPAYPRESLQIIPAFSYFDAFKLNIIGIPSWRTSRITQASRKLGPLYFIDDNTNKNNNHHYRKNFVKNYKRIPKVVELRSYDAMTIAANFIKKKDYQTRDEFDRDIRPTTEIIGLTGKWAVHDGIWIKEMKTFQISQGKIRVLF